MRICKVDVEPEFKPVKLEIVFEDKEEMEEFYTVFNFTPITDSLFHIDHNGIRNELSCVDYYKIFDNFEKSINKIMGK